MLVAEGAVDVAVEPSLAVWDMAALDIIVREAGGTFTNTALRFITLPFRYFSIQENHLVKKYYLK